MNTFEVKIDGIDYTKKAIFSITYGLFLDEQLDELNLNLKHLKEKDPFVPLTTVEITFTVYPESKQFSIKETNDTEIVQELINGRLKQSKTTRYIVANDIVNASPMGEIKGQKLYNHSLYLIEETKYLESFICDSLTFINAKGNVYVD